MHSFLFVVTITFPLPAKGNLYPKLLLECLYTQLNYTHIPCTVSHKCGSFNKQPPSQSSLLDIETDSFLPCREISDTLSYPQSCLFLPPSQLPPCSTTLVPQMATLFPRAIQTVQEYQN